ncbi:MAG: hypothetical protein QM635_06015 [Microbacteriaceae bacterium]
MTQQLLHALASAREAFDGQRSMTVAEVLGEVADAARAAHHAGEADAALRVVFAAEAPSAVRLSGVPWHDVLDAGLAEIGDPASAPEPVSPRPPTLRRRLRDWRRRMTPRRQGCPSWCIADHAAEEGGPHRAESAAEPALVRMPGGEVRPRELLLELHADRPGESWLYIGDGRGQFLDIDIGTAHRLAAAIEAYITNALRDPGAG